MEQAPAQQQFEGETKRHIGMRGAVAVAMAATVAFFASEAMTTRGEAGERNTLLEGLTPAEREFRCASWGTQRPFAAKSEYINSSRSKFRIAFKQDSVEGCTPIGQRSLVYFQEIQKDGEWQRNSRISKPVAGNTFKTVNSIVTAPYSCGSNIGQTMVRRVVRVTWNPKKPGVENTSQTYPGKAKNVC